MNDVNARRIILLALTVVLTAVLAFGQSDSGSISGFVKDPSGATIPNAKVTVKTQSGLERTASTNDSGYYIITNLPPSLYSLTVEAAGFKKFDSAGNKLDPSAVLTIEATLTVGSSTDTVEVSAAASKLQTESASVQSDVTREQIDALEINGRNPIFMANLVPGTRGGNLSSLSFNFSQGPSTINGARTAESLITYDGAPAVRTRSNGTSLGAADVDSTQEIQILTADYLAEYGRSSGGQIRIITKAGGQNFHGAVYDYVRNDAFNANTWTRNHTPGQSDSPAPINYNQFGYNIGGPFYIPGKFNKDKNKIFWYWGEEWVRYRFTDIQTMRLPSLLMRQGNFSELLDPNNYFYPGGRTIKDPSTGVVFPGNVIPSGQTSPNGLGILNVWPFPNLSTPLNGNQNWDLAANHPQHQRKDTLAVDFNFTDKQRMQFRRMNYAFWEYQPLDGNSGETPKYFNRPNQTNSADYVWTISPNKVNEVLATVSLDDVYIPVDQAHFLDRTTRGLNYPYIFPQGKLIPTRIPTVTMTNISTLNGGPYPSHSAGPIYDISDSFTWVKGSHSLKFGALFERQGENDNDEINVNACPTCTNNQNGQFSFTDTRSGQPTTGVAMANAALGLFDTYSELGQRAFTIFRGDMYEAFAQDSWKPSQKLHIDFGVRYTVIVPYHALWGNMAVFAPEFYDPTKAESVDPKTGTILPGSGDRYNGMVIPGSGWPGSAKGRFPESSDSSLSYLFRGVNNHYSDIQWGDFQPRLGIAYQITPKTVVRAGGGRYFTRLGVSDSIFLGGNPPFQPTANVTFGKVDNPGGTSTNLLPLTATTQSKAFKNPEAWAWNGTVQREMPGSVLVSAGYVARRGLHMQREADINQPTLATVLANPGVNLDALRPYKGYNSIRETDNVARSMYNSLQIEVKKRFSHDLAFGAAYTLSKMMDDGSAQRDIIPDTYNGTNLWGLSGLDVHQILTINYLYELPFFRGQHNFAGKALGGWQVSGITQFQTGTPCSVFVNNDYAGVGQDGNWDSCNGAGQFWAINGDPKIVHNFAANGGGDPNYWFAITNSDGSPIFTKPAAGTFVLQPNIRNRIHDPGFQNWNIGLFKQFPVNERVGFQFRAEAFDAFNHPNWNRPDYNPNDYNAATNSGTFGKTTGKSNERNLQLSLRLYF